MHSHYSIDYVMKLPIKNVIKLLRKAKERIHDRERWEMYVSTYPNMTEENFIPFSDFMKPEVIAPEATKEKILSSVKELLNANKGAWSA